ncbi:hypothetical protein EsDP_00002466 [Epichloe bromicola]|uniref:Uncharacterized protein n=1 Tax=Epichloe bromicola TaxID=79588 RepID=A0ABQ0CKZ0_9HYPO
MLSVLTRRSILPLLLLSSTGQGGVSVSAQQQRQRGDQSICDYYAAKQFGENNAATQLRLMQGIVAYAYAGGNSLPNGDKESTGIFNPGEYNGQEVYLRPWFDGTKATSNNNDQAVNIGWLDGGGTAPLVAFLNGSTPNAEIMKGTNQYKLFTHWYYVFGKVFSCSLIRTFLNQTFEPLNPAYVHKYMDLNQAHVGYFIQQLIIASKNFGFSDSDANTLSTAMNAKYNARCLPPTDNSLNSICLAKDCPVAAPSPNCNAYTNVKPRGVDTTASPSSPSSSSPSSSSSSSSPASGSPSSSSRLSVGVIAGIAIGGAIFLLLAVGMFLFFRRRNRPNTDAPPAPGPAIAHMHGAYPSGFPPPQYAYGRDQQESYHGRIPIDSYISYGASSPSPGWVEPKHHAAEELGTFNPNSPTRMTSPSPSRVGMAQLAEMESPEPPPGWNGPSEPPTSAT